MADNLQRNRGAWPYFHRVLPIFLPLNLSGLVVVHNVCQIHHHHHPLALCLHVPQRSHDGQVNAQVCSTGGIFSRPSTEIDLTAYASRAVRLGFAVSAMLDYSVHIDAVDFTYRSVRHLCCSRDRERETEGQRDTERGRSRRSRRSRRGEGGGGG